MTYKLPHSDPNTPVPATGSPTTPTIADALQALASWADLPLARRSNWASSLRLAAMIAGRRPEECYLTPEELRRSVLSKPAAAIGEAKGTLSNMRSALRQVMRRMGLIETNDQDISPAWSTLLAPIEEKERAAFSTFARFATQQGIEPSSVSNEVLADFESHLGRNTLAPNPRKLTGTVLGAWNRAARKVPGWPAIRLTPRRHGSDFIRPLSDFPASFAVDLDAFGAHITASDVLDRYAKIDLDAEHMLPRMLNPVCQITADTWKEHLRWGASALVASGVPITEVTSLACLVTPIDRIAQALAFIDSQHGGEHSHQNQHVANVLRKVATFWVPAADEDLVQVKLWTRSPTKRQTRMTSKNEAMLRTVFDPRMEQDLLDLPDVLLASARDLLPTDPATAASMAMRALALHIVAVLPLRLNNLRKVELDRHLKRTQPRGPFTYLEIPGHEAKGRKKLVYPVPEHIGLVIDEWLHTFRPHYAAAHSNYLFPGKKGPVITAQGLRDAMKGATREYVGVAISPHQHRHIAANRILRAMPGNFVDAKNALGHGSALTTERAYVSTAVDQAIERLDAVITGKRTRGPVARSRRTPKGRKR